ncbi:major facilitator superfamily domain-containing protein [Fennellomyces sp. T-0311]|nr:major facilitator superfamily domain-containing protein [Fennellomyces sp. T-0311]
MQDYYEREVFGSSTDVNVKLSAAGTLVAAMIYIFFIPTNILYNIVGPKVLLCVGTVMISGGLVAAAQATEIWHIYLSMSICSGIGVSIMYNVCFRVIPLWFDKKRNIAFAIMGTAQPFAGLILPFFITPLNSSLGAPWTFRILGLIFLVVNVIAIILIKEKPTHPQITLPKRSSHKRLDYSILLKTDMMAWLATGPILIAVVYLPYTFIPLYATYIGLSSTQGSNVVSVICGTGALGRITIGLLADYVGQLNTLIITSVITGLSFFLIWMFASNVGVLMAFAVIYGLFNGAYPVVAPPVTAAIVGMERYPLVISLLVTICGIGCLSPTIASSIESVSTLEPFMTYKLIAGCLCITGALLVLVLKLRLNNHLFSKI